MSPAWNRNAVAPRSKPRSRNGCKVCKDRRRKCDEAKPSCSMCLQNNIKCPGYPPMQFIWSTKHQIRPPFSLKSNPDCESEISSAFDAAIKATSVQPPRDTAASPRTSSEQSSPICGVTMSSASENITSAASPFELIPSARDLDDDRRSDSPLAVPGTPRMFDYNLESELTLSSELLAAPADRPEPSETVAPHMISTNVGETDSTDVAKNAVTGPPMTINLRNLAAAEMLRHLYRIEPVQYSDDFLVEYYFSTASQLQTLFIGGMEPFRVLTINMWQNSVAVSLAIQSISCAHLGQTDSRMMELGCTKQVLAKEIIEAETAACNHSPTKLNELLFANILLGTTACWYEATDLGTPFLRNARNFVHSKITKTSAEEDLYPGLTWLLLNAMIYWEMSVSFVEPQTILEQDEDVLQKQIEGLAQIRISAFQILVQTNVVTHPWTGTSPEIYLLLAEVGRLVRKHNNTRSPLPSKQDLAWARELNTALESIDLLVTVPNNYHASIYTTTESKTPNTLLQFSEAYRRVAQLQLYEVFPTILHSKLHTEGIDLSQVEPSHDPVVWIRTKMALKILRVLAETPTPLQTAYFQPTLLFLAGSSLRYIELVDAPKPRIQSSSSQVRRGRVFVCQRLEVLAKQLPKARILAMLQILKQSWRRMDLRWNGACHWLDVMRSEALTFPLG